MKKIGIVGSRRRYSNEDFLALVDAFNAVYEEGDMIVSGGCPKGADAWAEELAETLGISIIIHYPKRTEEIPVRFFNRNTRIAEDSDILLALVAPDRTGGTEDTVRKMERLRKPVNLVV